MPEVCESSQNGNPRSLFPKADKYFGAVSKLLLDTNVKTRNPHSKGLRRALLQTTSRKRVPSRVRCTAQQSIMLMSPDTAIATDQLVPVMLSVVNHNHKIVV